MFNANSKISIYINDEYLAITAVNANSLSGQVSSAIVKDIPAGAITRGWPKQFETLKKLINSALENFKPPLKPTEVVLVLSDTVVYTRVIDTPNISKEEIDSFVRKEIASTIPISAHEMKLSYCSIKSKAGERIVVTAVERKLLRAWQDFFKQMNITIDWFDVEMLALRRGLEASTASEISAVLDMGFHNSALAVYDEVGLIFSFYLPFGENYLLRRIARETNLPTAEIKEAINQGGLDVPDHQIGELLKEHLNLIVEEIIKNLDFYERGKKNKISKIIVTGRLGHLPGCKEYLISSKLGDRLHINELSLKLADDVYKAEGAIERAINKKYSESDPIFSPESKEGKLEKFKISKIGEYALILLGLIIMTGVIWWLLPGKKEVTIIYPEANPEFIQTKQIANLNVPLSLNEADGYFQVRLLKYRALEAMAWTDILKNAETDLSSQLKSGEDMLIKNNQRPEKITFPFTVECIVYQEVKLDKYIFDRLRANLDDDLVLLDYEITGLSSSSLWSITVSFESVQDFNPSKEQDYELMSLDTVAKETAEIKNLEEVLASAREEVKKETVLIEETGVGWLNARSGPGRNYNIVTKVIPGDEYVLVSEEDGWYEILYEASSSVWVSQEYSGKIEE